MNHARASTPAEPSRRRPLRAFAVATLTAAGLLAGCATPKIENQWSDPQFNGQSLRGARLFVVCEAPDEALSRQCQERLAAEAVALGATAVPATTREAAVPGRAGTPDAYLAAARDARTRAVLMASIGPAAQTLRTGPSIGLGVGGFGGGRVGGGLGISLPIGGGGVSTTYGANTLLTDVASGRLMWTANTSTPSSSDPAGQVGDLVKAAMAGAQKAGFF